MARKKPNQKETTNEPQHQANDRAGIVKEREVPAKEIEIAIERSAKFEREPEAHTFEE